MKVDSIRGLLDWTAGYYQHLSNCFSKSAEQQQNKRPQMLLNYLADKEMDLATRIRAFKEVGEDKALNTWCTEHIDKHPLMAEAACDDAFNTMDTNAIITEVEQQHQTIILLYENLYDRSQKSEIKELLAEVLDLQKQQAQQMMQGANRLEDI
ncbi:MULTISPECIES: hypothetical protein [unclassified Arsukibacterium]|uniref:hypothetical protein n=1 Tax=unclassified Arsukibacterium TaxID=2635278 RepID=UPI000C39AAE1|nr:MULTISPECIES: hypothetical protein [unclassified Arsukibacterium]MAA93156.1 hypothetical protein [Rheinheimera sp.]MBM33718.1 hypothetical protein [Rheinheimera sp.]HAW91438.1 hypothetical protein [Candidatus Azambacteria bacterium]|tara:strand:- start:340 stop:798 length:459 start_codon:yes stop_codon:yes gene_type:complete